MSNHEVHTLLSRLHDAAAGHNWRQCELVLFDLYPHLPAQDGLLLAVEQLGAHLETFEAYHTDITWPRDLLELVYQLQPVDLSEYDFPLHSDLRIYDADGTPTPGSDVFVSGLALLLDAFESLLEGSSEHSLDNAKGVIGDAIAAQTQAYGAYHCPEVWRGVRDMLADIRVTEEYNLKELESRTAALEAYDACVGAFQQELWTSLANALAARLG